MVTPAMMRNIVATRVEAIADAAAATCADQTATSTTYTVNGESLGEDAMMTSTWAATADFLTENPNAAKQMGVCVDELMCDEEGYTCGAAKLGAGILAALAVAATL